MIYNETLIGKVRSITGNKISVLLDESVKSTIPIIDGIVYRIGQIGSFVRIPLGYANLFGVVTQVGVDAIPETIKEYSLLEEKDYRNAKRWMSVVLIGERVGNKFERGIIQFPTADDDVHLVIIDDLNIIYGGMDEQNSIVVGNISVSESLPAKIDVDKLITRHCAILGSTGSGKSNAVAIILEAISKGDFKSSRIILIDPHGEYNESLKQYGKVFKINANLTENESELYIPFWALPFNELIDIFPGKLNDQNKDYIREKVLKLKLDSIPHLKNQPNINSVTSDSPIPFSIKDLWFDLDDFEKQTYRERAKPETSTLKTKGDPYKLISNIYEPAAAGGGSPFLNNSAKGIIGFLDGMKNRLTDQRFNFLFSPGEWDPDNTGKISKDLSNLLSEWLNHSKNITILDLQGIPSEIVGTISGALLKIIYDGLYWAQNLPVGGREQPILLVLEEAHNYLKAGENSISSRTVQTIAKEGRKFGVGLLLITQRPAELDETVLSQCGTIIALRMYNQGDRNHVSAAIQDELFEMVNLLPSLRTGECIIIGEAVKIPSRTKFFRISKAPTSSDPKVSELWKKNKPDSKYYEEAVFLWRNQNFKK